MTNKIVPEVFKKITDPIAIEWYNFGFRLAINYMHKIVPQSSKKTFEDILTRELYNGVEKDFFIDPTFEKNSLYAKITNPIVRRWYAFGFRFAINYIHETMTVKEKEILKALPDKEVYKLIKKDFFIKHPFKNYPAGWCPGDRPGSCIQCPNRYIRTVKPIKPPK